MTDQTTTVNDPAAGFPDLPDSLKVANRHKLGGNTQTLKMIKEAAMAKTTGSSKMDQLRALREQRAAEAEAKAEANPAGHDPAAMAARARLKVDNKIKAEAEGPKRKPLKFVDGRAKAKHALYDVRIDDTGAVRQFIVAATLAGGDVARVGEYATAQEARDGAADHHFNLVTNGAPIYKPAPQPKEPTVKANKKAKATSKKAKTAKGKTAKPVKAKAKANARKPVKGKTAARKPREDGAPNKTEIVAAALKKGWASSTALQAELGWQPHTLRGHLSGLRTKGATIETDRRSDGTYYRFAK